MTSLDQFIDDLLLHGRAYFDREEALSAVELKQASLTAAISRLVKDIGWLTLAMASI